MGGMTMTSRHLGNERRDPDDDEDWTAMKLREHVRRQVETSSTDLVTENHHDKRVEDERVVDGRYTTHSVVASWLHVQ